MPEVSVIIPVYNAEKYIKDCVRSILRQSFEDFEVIIVMMALKINLKKYVRIWYVWIHAFD